MRKALALMGALLVAGCVSNGGGGSVTPLSDVQAVGTDRGMLSMPISDTYKVQDVNGQQHARNIYAEHYKMSNGEVVAMRIQKVQYYMRRPAATDFGKVAGRFKHKGQRLFSSRPNVEQFGAMVYATTEVKGDHCVVFRKGVGPVHNGYKALVDGKLCRDGDETTGTAFREEAIDFLRRIKWRG